MAKKKKSNPSKKYFLSDKQLEREKRKLSKEMTDKISLILLTAFADEVEDSIIKFDSMCKELRIGKERAEKIKTIFRFDDEMLCRVHDRGNRYATFKDENLVKMRDFQKSIEKHTGAMMKGW